MSVPLAPLAPPPTRNSVALQAVGVTKLYGHTIALWRVELTATSGELVAVHGPNASGKSTFLRIIAGLTAPTTGRVVWAGVAGAPAPRIALVGHASHLYGGLTPIENVALTARLARRDQRVGLELLERLGVARVSASLCRDLSAGTLRRVALARALAADPDVVLLDEPFASLDAAASVATAEMLEHLHATGRLVFYAGHDEARTRGLATRVIELDRGRIVADRRPGPSGVGAVASV
ncbi:MAG TPA: ATP-binding cassette domain-containing protein [Candidatus Saccharimonadales bacterium]|nr:ATP-binding cassette domain-containing protein [Candidatus Saccharimonadales bacterium]